MERNCLKCQQPFDASGKFNRLCQKCRKENTRLERFELKLGRMARTTPRNGKIGNQDATSSEQ